MGRRVADSSYPRRGPRLRRSEDNATNIAAHVEKNKKDQTKKDTAEKKTPDALKKRSVDTTPLKSSPAQQNTQRPATTPRSKQLINVPLENMTAANVEQNSKEDAIRKDETLAVPAEASQNTAQLNEIKETNIIAPVAETSVAAVQKEKPIVLEYTLAGVEPETPVEKGITLTMELKEKSRFQKVFDFARGAKNSDGPFTVLRQAKQELFAFNLKKDKHPK